MTIQVITAAAAAASATAGQDSLQIPLADLTAYGLTSAELTNDSPGKNRAISAIVKRLHGVVNAASNLIGLSAPLPSQAAGTFPLFSVTYSLTTQYLSDIEAGTTEKIPLPSSGANAGVGGIAIANIFPGAAKIANAGAVSAASVLIPVADLALLDDDLTYSSLNVASGQDNRDWIAALFGALVSDATLRSTSIASAFTSRSFGTTPAVVTPSTAQIATTDPTTGLSPTKVASGLQFLLSKSLSLTINQAFAINGTYDESIVTS